LLAANSPAIDLLLKGPGMPVLRLKPHLAAHVVSPEEVALLGESGRFALRGKVYAAVVPLLDGKRSDDAIVARLRGRIAPELVYYALGELEAKGYAAPIGSPSTDPASDAWWSGRGVATPASSARLVDAGAHRPALAALRRALGTGRSTRRDATRDLVVVATGDYLDERMEKSIRAALPGACHVLPVRLAGATIWIGPLLDAKTAGLFKVLLRRLKANRPADVADPWNTNLEFAGTQRVFIVGTGLTMADIVTRLTEQNATTRIYAISRHGRLAPPQQQLQTDALSDGVIAQMLNSATVRDLMKSARFVATAAAALGGDWREVVNAIRHFAPTFWRRFSPEDRGRFLRHVRSHWDVFRHRLAPRAYQQICTARQREQLHIGAGRICEIVPADQAIRVRWTPRGATETREQEVDTVINCTGPEYRPSRSRDPLLRQLLDSGLATEDAHALGLRTGKHGELIGHNGVPSSNLYYIGPMLRAEHWEATAVAELRLHAEQLAAHLAAKVAVNRGATARPVDSIDQSIVALEHLS